MLNFPIPVLGFAAFSGTGKTTLLEALIPLLNVRGVKVGMLKHAHHDFDIDTKGKDSYRLRKAGAEQMLIASRNRFAFIEETPEEEPCFETLLRTFDISKLDLILVEGCKDLALPKIELHRSELNKPWLHVNDNHFIAVVSDIIPTGNLPHFDINDLESIADFVKQFTQQFAKRPLK